MFLAVTAMFFHVLATPTYALSTTSANAVAVTTAVVETAPAEPGAKLPEAMPEAGASPADHLMIDANASSGATYAPGSLVRELVPAATPAESSFTSSSMSPGLIAAYEAREKEARWQQHQKKIWMALTIAQSGAATMDAWSTRQVISSGQGRELNPMLRPFAGNDSIYAAIQVGPLLLDYIGRRMLTSQNGFAKHTWWIPQAVGTAMSLASGASNLALHSAP